MNRFVMGDHIDRTSRRAARWITGLLLLGLVGASAAGAPAVAQGFDDLQARVWIEGGGGDVFHRGDRASVYYRATTDAYVAIFHIDTDGIVRLLHPRVPGEDHYVRRDRTYRLRFARSSYWYVDDYPGVGYFFIVASWRPMDFSSFHYSRVGGGWDLEAVGRRVYQDPYLAMDDFVAALVPDWQTGAYALDFAEYHVDRRYEYPRFLCYDCHSFRTYRSWNPYRYQCHSFRLIIHTDPYFYPVTRYRGTRVVYARPPVRDVPRFAFKERDRGEPARPIFQPASETDLPGVAGAERRRSTSGQGAREPRREAVPRSAPAPRRESASGLAPSSPGPDARRSGGDTPSSAAPRSRRPSDAVAPRRSAPERAAPSRSDPGRAPADPPDRGRPGAATPPRSPSDRGAPSDRSPRDIERDAPDRSAPDRDPPRPVLERRNPPSTSRPGRGSSRPSRPSESTAPRSGDSRPSASPTPRGGNSRPSASPAPRGGSSRPSASPAPRRSGDSRPSASPAPRGSGSRPSASPAPRGGGGSSDRSSEPRERGRPR